MKFNKELCLKLKETYNTFILSNLDKDNYKILRIICAKLVEIVNNKNFKDNEDVYDMILNCNYVLAKLIYNLSRFHMFPKYKSLFGPCSIALFQSKKYRKTIYVIGEYHCSLADSYSSYCKKEKNNTDVSSYLTLLAERSPVFLDMFIEFPPTVKKGDLYDFPIGVIGEIGTKNVDCFVDRKNYKDNCVTARWHYIDSRFDNNYVQISLPGYIYYDINRAKITNINWTKINKSKFLDFILSPISKGYKSIRRAFESKVSVNNMTESSLTIPGLKELIKSFGIKTSSLVEYKKLVLVIYTLYSPEMVEFYNLVLTKDSNKVYRWVDNSYRRELLNKELSRSYKKDLILSNLNNFIKQQYLEREREIYWCCVRLNNIKTMKLINLDSELKILGELFSNIGTIFTDSYFLARVFKRFRLDLQKDHPTEPSNIVFYAGDAHAVNVREFLRNVIDDFDMISFDHNISCNESLKYKYLNEREMCCLELNNTEQPLFLNYNS